MIPAAAAGEAAFVVALAIAATATGRAIVLAARAVVTAAPLGRKATFFVTLTVRLAVAALLMRMIAAIMAIGVPAGEVVVLPSRTRARAALIAAGETTFVIAIAATTAAAAGSRTAVAAVIVVI